MTDKPMDVECTLRELAQEIIADVLCDTQGIQPRAIEHTRMIVMNRIINWREALREPGASWECRICGSAAPSYTNDPTKPCKQCGHTNWEQPAVIVPGAEAAPPLCVICGKREEMHGASNQCNLDEEFSPRWTPPRAAAGESTERAKALEEAAQLVESVGAVINDSSDMEDEIWSRRMHNIAERIRNLAASQERSATPNDIASRGNYPPLTCSKCGRRTWCTDNGLCERCSPNISAAG